MNLEACGRERPGWKSMTSAGIGRHRPGGLGSRGGGLFVRRGTNSLPIRVFRYTMLRAVPGMLAAFFLSVMLAGQDSGVLESVMVRCSTSCDVLAASILAFGGTVTFRYQNVDALAATLPSDRLPDLLEIAGERAVWKDRLAPVPDAIDESVALGGRGGSSASLDGSDGASLRGEQVTR